MSAPLANNVARVLRELTPAEREGAVAYLASKPIDREERLAMPGVEIVPEVRSLLAFIDQDPTANWGHRARYILIDCDDLTRAVSIPVRLPPFRMKGGLHWQLVYRAAAVPDSAVVLPEF